MKAPGLPLPRSFVDCDIVRSPNVDRCSHPREITRRIYQAKAGANRRLNTRSNTPSTSLFRESVRDKASRSRSPRRRLICKPIVPPSTLEQRVKRPKTTVLSFHRWSVSVLRFFWLQRCHLTRIDCCFRWKLQLLFTYDRKCTSER